MTTQEHFQEWIKDYHPEADLGFKNGVYVNSTTRLLFAGFKGAHDYFLALKREKEGREFT